MTDVVELSMELTAQGSATTTHCWIPVPHGTVSRMKTTIVLPDDLFAELKRLAATEGVTIKGLVENAVRRTLAERQRPAPQFKLRDCAVGGDGLSPEFAQAEWGSFREAIYDGPGG